MSYDARRQEVMTALANEKYIAEKTAKITETLDNYFRIRNGLIANTLDCLDPGRKGPCLRAWLDRGKQNTSAVAKAFEKVEVGKFFLSKIYNEERRFFFLLEFSDVPRQRDRMVKYTEELNKAMREFSNKWEKIKDNDEDIDDRIKRTSEEFDKLLVKAAHTAARVEKDAREKMVEQARKAVGTASLAVDGGIIETILNTGARALEVIVNQTNSRRYEIFALLSHQEKVFGTFKETREMVAEFLEENGYPLIKDALDDANNASNVTAAKMNTDGQKSDASVWAKEARDELYKVFRVAEQAYLEFARKHEYLFFGPLGSGYYKELSEDDSWKSFSRRWQDHREDFDDLLRERTLNASESQILEVSLDGLSREDRRKIYDELVGACRELLRAWNKVKEVAKNSADDIMDTREGVRDIVEAMR